VPHTTQPGCVVYVSKSGNDNNSGTSWAEAKLTVQAGINAAAPSQCEVWVAEGVYNERITLANGVAVYGGFAGDETVREQRDWAANLTVLDGAGLSGSGVTASSLSSTGTRIDGFTIRGGSATAGGGVHCNSASPAIVHNTITANSATVYGAGICCYSSSPIISSNVITENWGSHYGGGVFCDASCPTISDNVLQANHGSAGSSTG